MNAGIVRRRQLGAELRRLRLVAEVGIEHAAAELDCTRQKIANIEGGKSAPSKPELLGLLDLYGAKGSREKLEGLRVQGNARGWWSKYKLPSHLAPYVALEANADTVVTIESEVIPGLLQTEAYARRIHALGSADMDAESTERIIDSRRRRASRLTDTAIPMTLRAIVSEAAVLRALHDPTVGAEQVRHLIELSRLPTVSMLVVPLAAGLLPMATAGFSILHFTEIPSVAYQESAISGRLIESDEAVVQLGNIWTVVASTMALDAGTTSAWLTGRIEEQDHG